MSQKIEVILYDDLEYYTNQAKEIDAEYAAKFALNGVEYEIDLCAKNMSALEDLLMPYMKAGRKVSPSPKKNVDTRSYQGRMNSQARNNIIREWAITEGYNIAANGRIPTAIIAEYRKQMEGK